MRYFCGQESKMKRDKKDKYKVNSAKKEKKHQGLFIYYGTTCQ